MQDQITNSYAKTHSQAILSIADKNSCSLLPCRYDWTSFPHEKIPGGFGNTFQVSIHYMYKRFSGRELPSSQRSHFIFILMETEFRSHDINKSIGNLAISSNIAMRVRLSYNMERASDWTKTSHVRLRRNLLPIWSQHICLNAMFKSDATKSELRPNRMRR